MGNQSPQMTTRSIILKKTTIAKKGKVNYFCIAKITYGNKE